MIMHLYIIIWSKLLIVRHVEKWMIREKPLDMHVYIIIWSKLPIVRHVEKWMIMEKPLDHAFVHHHME